MTPSRKPTVRRTIANIATAGALVAALAGGIRFAERKDLRKLPPRASASVITRAPAKTPPYRKPRGLAQREAERIMRETKLPGISMPNGKTVSSEGPIEIIQGFTLIKPERETKLTILVGGEKQKHAAKNEILFVYPVEARKYQRNLITAIQAMANKSRSFIRAEVREYKKQISGFSESKRKKELNYFSDLLEQAAQLEFHSANARGNGEATHEVYTRLQEVREAFQEIKEALRENGHAKQTKRAPSKTPQPAKMRLSRQQAGNLRRGQSR